jgi:hypothetical protein
MPKTTEKIRARTNAKNLCICGGHYTSVNKTKHERTVKHQAYVNARDNLIAQLNTKYGEEDWTNATLEELREMVE